MNFEGSQKYLYSLGNEVLAMKFGLENIRKLLTAIGNPQNKYKKVQVAGTNGKGSTCAFLDSICRQAHIETGLFTSPHLISITERIKINGKDISEDDFAKYATRVHEAVERESIPATFFEQVTAIALLAFAEKKIELAILETGMGGRLDATTAANAEIVGITRIDYDHQRYLGETLKEIAGEKAAIIRTDTKVVATLQSREAVSVIEGRCREVGVEPVWATTDITVKKRDSTGLPFPLLAYSFETEKSVYPDVLLSLNGKHQAENAALAIGLAEELHSLGFRVTDEAIWLGLETAKHKGRLEYYAGILFDGAHNPGGATALREYLEEFVTQPITLIFGAMLDKKIDKIAPILFPVADKLILTRAENQRAADPIDLEYLADKKAIVTESVEEALNAAKQFPENLTCVTGSLYLIGEARKLLSEQI